MGPQDVGKVGPSWNYCPETERLSPRWCQRLSIFVLYSKGEGSTPSRGSIKS